MQRKKHIRNYGVAALFHKNALEFVAQWEKEPMRVPLKWIENIERVAA